MAPAVPFDSFPNELKLQVFEILYKSRRDYTRALRVCQEWNDLGTPLLWTYVPISNDSVLPFIHSLESARTTTGALVRNLSVQLHPLPIDTTAVDDLCLATASKKLATLIESRLHGLTSFSYRIAMAPVKPFLYPPGNRQGVPFLPIEVAASLIDGLPTSCSTLEFSTNDHVDDGKEFEESHSMHTNCLSEALKRRAPYLEHLHLQDEYMVPFVIDVLMIGPRLSRLESLSLDISGISILHRLHAQYGHLGPRYSQKQDLARQTLKDRTMDALRNQNLIVQELRSSYHAGRFPSIKHLNVVAFQTHGIHVFSEEVRVNTVDVLLGHINVLPITYKLLGLDPGIQSDGEPSHDLTAVARISRDDGQLKFLDENGVGLSMSSDLPWASSTTGIRIPIALKRNAMLDRYNIEWADPSLPAMKPLDYLKRLRAEHSARMAVVAAGFIKHVTGKLRLPYIADCLLEWYD